MNRKMYWGVALLILLIGTAAVFMLTRTTETEPVTVYNPLTEADKKQVEQNIQDAIDKEKQNLPPIAEEDRQQVEIEKPQVAEVSKETESSDGEISEAGHEFIKSWLPTELESTEKRIEFLEKAYKGLSFRYQRHPDRESYRKDMESIKKRLDAANLLKIGITKRMEEYENEGK